MGSSVFLILLASCSIETSTKEYQDSDLRTVQSHKQSSPTPSSFRYDSLVSIEDELNCEKIIQTTLLYDLDSNLAIYESSDQNYGEIQAQKERIGSLKCVISHLSNQSKFEILATKLDEDSVQRLSSFISNSLENLSSFYDEGEKMAYFQKTDEELLFQFTSSNYWITISTKNIEDESRLRLLAGLINNSIRN